MLLPKQRLPTCRQRNLDKTLKGSLGKLQESQLKGRGMNEKMSGCLFLDHVISKLPCLWEKHVTLRPQVTRALCVRGSGIFLIRTVIFCSDNALCNMYRIAGGEDAPAPYFLVFSKSYCSRLSSDIMHSLVLKNPLKDLSFKATIFSVPSFWIFLIRPWQPFSKSLMNNGQETNGTIFVCWKDWLRWKLF